MERIHIGNVAVDAGCIWIGDPCYILHGDDGNLDSKGLGRAWSEFCDILTQKEMDKNKFASFDGTGICVSSGFGDGQYPVYAEIKDCGDWGKRVARVTIEFISEREEEDEEANADADEFECEECGDVQDIEDSVKKNDVLLCPSCAEKQE